MKKIIYLFVIFFVKHSAFSQESIKVSYKNYYDLSVPILRNSELYIHDNKTVYIEDFTNDQTWGGVNTVLDPKILNNAVKMNRYFDFEYTVIENETMFSYVWIIDRLFKVFENKPVFNWSITSEYKIVNDRKLRLATTKFRGFEWNVWFDENIPLPYGPWKFNGLPGLILEAKEVNGRYRYVVHRIDYEFESNYSIPTEYEQISLRDFVELNDDFYDLEKTSTRDFKVRVVGGSKKLSRNRELIYEWEDENKE